MVLVTKAMIPLDQVVCCLEKEQISEVASLFLNNKISSVLVVNPEKTKVLGIITKTDLINAFLTKIPMTTPVHKLMSPNLVFANDKYGRDKVGQLMVDNQVHHVIIENDQKEPIGLVTTMDIIKDVVEESKLELARLLMTMPRAKPVLK